jgi:DNA-binding LytR/AlgR family response regulator
VFGLWVYDKAREDYLEAENEQGMQVLTGLAPVSSFTISEPRAGTQVQRDRIPIKTNGFHLFFAGEEFVYSDHTGPKTIIHLRDGKDYNLGGRVTRETLRAYLEAADVPVSVEQSYVLNLDQVRALESRKADRGNSYKYQALMMNGKRINVSQKSFPEIRDELVKNGVQLVDEDQ